MARIHDFPPRDHAEALGEHHKLRAMAQDGDPTASGDGEFQ